MHGYIPVSPDGRWHYNISFQVDLGNRGGGFSSWQTGRDRPILTVTEVDEVRHEFAQQILSARGAVPSLVVLAVSLLSGPAET